MQMKNIVAIIGNTGTGKSQLAVELAKIFNGEIINADSMQVYKGLNVVTNKHPLKERQGIKHHLLGHVDWDHNYTVNEFEAEVQPIIHNIQAEKKLPIVVGGTHYYIQALIAKNSTIGQREKAPREPSTEEIEILDSPELVEKHLNLIDPKIHQKFHPNDTRRLRRALEVYYTTGELPSEIYKTQATKTMALRYRVLVLWVFSKQEPLNERLDLRVDAMVEQGLFDEIRELYGHPHQTNLHGVFQVIGFKQFLPFLARKEPLQGGLEAMKLETRQYAKKQTKYIVNKLIPLLNQLGGTLAALDASDLSQWDTKVNARAQSIVKRWLNEEPIEDLIPSDIDVSRKKRPFDASQWTRYTCDACSTRRGEPVVIIGDESWEIHVASKGHRYAARKFTNEPFTK